MHIEQEVELMVQMIKCQTQGLVELAWVEMILATRIDSQSSQLVRLGRKVFPAVLGAPEEGPAEVKLS